MTKKLMMMVAAVAAAFSAWAATETIGGYTWTYRINGDKAEVYNNGVSAAISPLPSGIVIIPATLGNKPVVSVGKCAFYGCENLTHVTIPSGVMNVAGSAFRECRNLTSVAIPNSVTNIGDTAFQSCSSLAGVTIPDSVTNIGEGAFFGCRGLTSMSIPASVTNIGNYAFSNCGSLMFFVSLGDNPSYKVDSGLLLTSDGKTLVAGVNGDVTIPDSVTSIGRSAFYGRTGLTNVAIPDSVTNIGESAFYGCNSLKSVTIVGSVANIGDNAFGRCSSLVDVTIPQCVLDKTMMAVFGGPGGEQAFCSITNVSFSPTITNISYGAFSGCFSLASVSIPDTVISIDDYAFLGTDSLTQLIIPDSVTHLGTYAFGNQYDNVSTRIYLSRYYSGSLPSANVTILRYEPHQVVTLNANGGAVVPESISVDFWSYYGEIPVPEREEGRFSGWTLNDISVDSATRVTALRDHTLLAKWDMNQYWVAFEANGGTGGRSAKQDYGSAIVPPTVTREGYTFTGWSPNVSATAPANDVTYTAQWEINQYTVTFDANGGIGGVTNVLDYASEISAPIVSRIGYTFEGWMPNVAETVPASNVMYTAQWKINQYTVSFDANGGIGGRSEKQDYGSSIIAPNVSRVEGVFLGWEPAVDLVVPDHDVVYVAQWDMNQYMVTFDANGGTGGRSAKQDYGSAIVAPTVTREGYTFTGWLPSVAATVPANDVTYTAQWKINQYAVSFDANGGTGGRSAKQDYGSAIVAPTVTRTGYSFTGWSPSVAATVPANDVTYTAQWKINQYTVAFDANGGTGGRSAKQNYGSAIAPPTVTKEWCDFAGWSPTVDAKVPAMDVTYTAQWARWGDTISASKMGGKTMKQLYPNDYTRMTTVVLEEGITDLPVGFFSGCGEVTDVTWPSTLVEFGKDAIPPKILAKLSYDANGLMIYNGWILDYQDRNASAVTIPEGIVGIGRGAFKEMFDLETVTMPESLRCIASGAFEDCSWLLNLQFMSGLRYVGPVAFRGCSSLLGASFADGVEILGTNVFENCWQMKSVRLPYTVTNIGVKAFTGCSAIRGVTVPTHLKTMQALFPASYAQIETAEVAEGETTVMDDMFAGCVALRGGATQTDMSMIPNTVTNIGARAFQGCTSLTAFVVPDSVVEIGASAFQGCTALWNVTLSRSLTEIPDYAFYGCSMLETMVVPENVNYLGNRFFSGRTVQEPGRVIENALYYLCTNAPSCHSGAYGAISNVTTYVLQDSRSWDGRQGSRVLPQSWNGYDITYWTPNRFDVIFDANGGQFDSMGGSTWSEQQITDTTYALPSTEPVRPGWAFEGWWDAQTGGAEVRYTSVVTATRTHTIYAHWRSLGNKMTVTFNSNGGTVVTPGAQDYVPGQTFGQFPAPTRRGYTFQGWWTEAVNGIRMTEATQVPAADMELFAHWKPITYYVRFHANGGTGTMSDQPFTFDVSGALKTHAFTRTGFAFTGWATTPSGQVRYAENKTVVNLEEVDGHIVDLYAVWSGVGYSVRFDSNGGTGIMDNQTIAVGETQNLWPCAFARGGYTFAGWAVSPTDAEAKKVTYRDGQAVKNLATSNGATVPLYAVWVTGSQTVRITFDANGGSVAPNDYWDCVVGTAVEAFPTPTRPGFTFAGWWTAKTGGTQVSSIARVTSAQTFYAHWTENGGVVPGDNLCTVTFNANGGSVTPTTRKVESGMAVGGLPTPLRTDYAFLGWWTAANGGTLVTNSTIVRSSVTYYAHWRIWTEAMQAFVDAIDATGDVSLDANGNIVVTLTNDVSGTVEIPDNVGAVTIDLNGHDMVGDGGLGETALPGGPAIRIVKGDGESGGGVAATRLAIVDTSDGEKGQIAGGGESAGIEIAGDAALRVRLDVEGDVGVFNGDGTEQDWRELSPVEFTLVAGEYVKLTLAELGYDVPTDGTPYSVVAKGLPAGLQLKYNAAVTKKVKQGKTTKTVVVKPAKVEWWIEGVPTAAVDFFTNPPYLVITANGKTVTEPLPIEVLAQDVTMLEDLALGQSLNEQFYLPGVTSGWAVSGLPTGLKYTAKLLTTGKKVGKKTVVTTNALPYSVYGKATKAGLFTITAKQKVGGYYETLKYRVLVRPKAVDATVFSEELTNITTMAYVPVEWDLTGDGGHAGRVPLPVVENVAKVTGLPGGIVFAAKDTYAYANAKKKTGKYLKQYGQTIVGTPTKPGTYVVTFTKNVTTGTGKNKKTVAKTAQILWTVTANDANLELGFNTAGGVIEGGTVGLKYGDLMAFSATDGATVTASGMPAGITLANLGGGSYAFRGFTTKAGTYLVTVKATLKGKTVTQRVALKVDGLPSWAKGTFNGYIADEDGATNGLATITVSSVGKISGKFQEGGTNWTFTAASYTGYDDAAPAYSVPVVAKYSYKEKEKVKVKGKWTTKTVTKSVARDFTLRVGQDALGGVATLEEVGGGSTVHAWQNLWGSTYKAIGKKLFYTSAKKPYRVFTINAASDVGAQMGLLPTETLSLKVTPTGAVTATMSFDTGKKSKGKAVIYKATCSTTVIPLFAADAEEFEGEAILFFAPSSANGFPGFAGAAPF